MPFTALDVQARMQELSAAGAPFALRDFDIDGIALKGYANAPADLVQLLQTGRAHGDKPFIVYEDQRLSFEDFFARADILASRLQSDFGIAKGERVAIAMRNCPHWAIAFVAAVLAGAVVVPLNSWGKAGELLFGVEDSGARVLVCDAQRFADKCCHINQAVALPVSEIDGLIADRALHQQFGSAKNAVDAVVDVGEVEYFFTAVYRNRIAPADFPNEVGNHP